MTTIADGIGMWALVLGMLCGAAGFRLGWRTRNRWALPAVQGAFGFLAFGAAWKQGGPVAGAIAVAGWVAGSTAASLSRLRADPAAADALVLRAAAYRASMLDWLRSGRGFEGRATGTAREHLRELAVYLFAALVSGNALAIVLGAVLLNSMNAWVASLLRAARRPWTVRALGWPPWSVLRVLGYVMLGAACAAPAASTIGVPAPSASAKALLLWGGGAVVADFAVKLAASRAVGRALGRAVDLDALGSAP